MLDFSLEPELSAQLEWMNDFVRTEVEPLDLLFPEGGLLYDVGNEQVRSILRPLQQRVRDQGLWACHLDSEFGGKGYGQVQLAYMNEILGRSWWGPTVFGTAAPDTGNAEILARFGTGEQKERYLQPLLDGEIVSCFSMTEPQAGADPKEFVCSARRDGDSWVIDGEKWFSSNLRYAAFAIVMAVTDPDAAPHKRATMLLVPTDTPGFDMVRPLSNMGHIDGPGHWEIAYEDCRVPVDVGTLGQVGSGFKVAQDRLGPGRIHHCMRLIGVAERALELMCRRAESREMFGTKLSERQFVQDFIATSRAEIDGARLVTQHAAWKLDLVGNREARKELSVTKLVVPTMALTVVDRAIQVFGGAGVSDDTPLSWMYRYNRMLRIGDGADEVHKQVLARMELARWTT